MKNRNNRINQKNGVAAVAALVASCLLWPAMLGASFVQVVSLDDVRNDPQNDRLQNFVFDGGDLYVALGGESVGGGNFEGHAINRVTGVGTGSPTVTNIMSSSDWGSGFFSPIRSFQKTGDVLQFGATGAASVVGIYQLDVVSGALTTRFDATAILAAVPETALTYTGASVTDAAGEFYFANARSGHRALYKTNGTAIDRLLDAAQLEALFDGASNETINAMTLAGDNLFLANNSNNLLASYDVSDASTGVAIDTATLLGVAGGTSISFTELFAAPDGLVYFGTTNRQILSFDPANPAGSLTMVLADAISPLQALGWYDGNIAFATTLGTNEPGIYAIPEPRFYAGLFGLGALALVWLRRRRK